MATNKKGGGSSIVLILFLVFFVLSTLILGITTYLAYSEQEKMLGTQKKAEPNNTPQMPPQIR